MQAYYFTFGQAHVHALNFGKADAETVFFDKDTVVEIEADDDGEARDLMFRFFGKLWAFMYREAPDMSYFPKGIIRLKDVLHG
jgi:uncharacterized DUF497 family protein